MIECTDQFCNEQILQNKSKKLNLSEDFEEKKLKYLFFFKKFNIRKNIRY